MRIPSDLPAGPESLRNLEFLRDLTPYVFLADGARGRDTLEIGVGSGHGCWMLREAGASRLVVADLDPGRVLRAVHLIGATPPLRGVAADAQSLPFGSGSFDMVTCFEVIEHVPDPERLLDEIRRALRADGIALISTPNRVNRLLPFQRPWNPEHRFEYSFHGFRRAIARHFETGVYLGIVGDAKSQAFYLDLWRQKPLRVYSRAAKHFVVGLLPGDARSWVRRARASAPESGRQPPAPADDGRRVPEDRESWPFRTTPGDIRHALNFVAICGSRASVQRAAADLPR